MELCIWQLMELNIWQRLKLFQKGLTCFLFLCACSVVSGGATGGARSQAIQYGIEYIIEHEINTK